MREHKMNSTPEYMKQAGEYFQKMNPGQRILDIPAGSGKLTQQLRNAGHIVTPADINEHQSDYVYADMNKRLPFADNHFDAVVCLEGLEHLLDPYMLMQELIRVTRVGGQVMISTPNIMNMYSRLQFLLTGTFYQFHPSQLEDIPPGEMRDRFHISPMSYHRIRYLAEHLGASVKHVSGDKIKRLLLLPLYVVIRLLGKPWSWSLFCSGKYKKNARRNMEIYNDINSGALLYSRSLIIVLQKEASAEQLYDQRRTVT
ncbi:MAG: class I SAM-dependent methyltransferase [Planctomycetota bacterium]|nr:MAG: class I SAM-dependent methyltransferase [Planctomycetota bacterium]